MEVSAIGVIGETFPCLRNMTTANAVTVAEAPTVECEGAPARTALDLF